MSPTWRVFLGLMATALATGAQAQSNSLHTAPAPFAMRISGISNGLTTPRVVAPSPVAFFRKLLQASPTERNQLLANRATVSRERLLAKVREYEAMDPEDREFRLLATELRWYLMPLMRTPPTERAGQLAQVPADILPLVKSRLLQWDILPPPYQKEFLAHDDALRYFVQAPLPAAANAQPDKIADRLSAFLTLTPEEKKEILGRLSEPERVQMENTLKTFDGLPPQQRLLCVRNFGKFAGMSEAERAEFLKNAESWSKMSAEERRTWQDLVAHVPMWPPLPPIMPPLPPTLAPGGHKTTN